MTPPLEGIRVLDLTHVLAGPFATHQLAMLGADVIKIEPPGRPDMTREEGVVPELNAEQFGTYFHAQNAGKRAMTLDLSQPGAADVMRRLIAGADVLVQNYAGGAMERLGFGAEAAMALNPRLVYCMLSGFGRTGPKADHPAYDVVIQAYSGMMHANADAGEAPRRIGPPVVDYGTGAQAALAITAALFRREQTGHGERVDVSMLDAALMLMSAFVADTGLTGDPPPPHTNAHKNYAGYATFETADGTLMIGAWTNVQLARLLDLLGETGRAAEVRATPRAEIGATRDADRALIARHMATRTAAEWETLLNASHLPAARVRRLDETLGEEQLRHRGVLQASGLPEGAPPVLPVAAYLYGSGSPQVGRPPPRLGEHTEEILRELGLSDAEISGLRAQAAI